jgi:hypothetical protein
MIKSGAIALGILAVLAAVIWIVWRHLFPWPYSAEVGGTVVVGSIASVIAVWAIFSQRAITRRQVTLEYIATLETDGDLIRGRAKFRELVNTPGAMAGLANDPIQEQTPEFQAVTTRLNEFELISIGIQRGIIDIELYMLWYKTGTVRAWHDAQPFIAELRNRTGKRSLFYEFEHMVGWIEKNERPPRSYWWGQFF